MDILQRESIYIWYYFTIQFQQIFWYWIIGMVVGSIVSVFLKERIHRGVTAMKGKKLGFLGVVFASLLGIASPLCMYGTIPIAASFSRGGVKDDWLAAFMMSSILLNPQLIVYSAALGLQVLTIRIVTCFICGILAGVLIRVFYGTKVFFDFSGFEEPKNKDTDSNRFIRFLKNLFRNFRATGLYFLLGIFLSALFQRYVPAEAIAKIFGGNEAWGVLMAATVGVPLYVCGGGTIPLLQSWLESGMSLGSATAFMVTGPATKITNLGALKAVLGIKHFLIYWIFVIFYSFISGVLINLLF